MYFPLSLRGLQQRARPVGVPASAFSSISSFLRPTVPEFSGQDRSVSRQPEADMVSVLMIHFIGGNNVEGQLETVMQETTTPLFMGASEAGDGRQSGQ